MASCNRWAYLAVVLVTLGVLVAGGVLHLMNWWEILVDRGVFDHTATFMWDSYAADLVYSKWMLFTWVAVYGLQFFWVLYGVELCFRRSKSGNLYSEVPILPASVFIFFTLAVAATFGYHLLWTSTKFGLYAPLAMLGACICSYVAIFLAASSLNRHQVSLHADARLLWEGQWFVQNALGAFAALTTIVLLYQVTSQTDLLYRLGESGPSYLFMGLLQFYILVWLVIDLFLSRQILPYLLTPFFLTILAFIQVVMVHHEDSNHHFLMGAVFLGFTCFLTLVKLWNVCGIACCQKQR